MADANGHVKDALRYLDQHFEDFKRTLVDLSRIPSVSAQGFPPEEVRRSAEATAEVMRRVGIENVQVLEIPDVHPYVYGDWIKKPGAPTILLYGHHDVQPPGRPEKWHSPAFEPTERKGRLYGRGTADDKAGVMAHVAAVACYLQSAGSIPCNVKFLIEGEEEIGSENLGKFLEKYKDMMMADFIVLSDTANFDTGIPALTYQLRGIAQVDVEVQVLDHPLHSGMWGGPVPDPVQVLSKLIAGLTGKDGKLKIPGLYDDVAKPSGKQKKRIRTLPFDEKKFKHEGGLAKGVKLAGEPKYSRLRAAVDAAVADGHRDGVASHPGLLQPDRGLGTRTALAAHGAEHRRPQGGRLAREEAHQEAALRREGDGQGHRHHALVDDRPRGPGVRGGAPRAQGRLRQGDGDDRRGRDHRLRAAVRRPAGRRAVPADGRRGPAVQRALREREPAPGRLAEVHEVGDPPVRRAVAGRTGFPEQEVIARRCGRLAGCALAAALVPMAALAQAARRGPLEVREEFLLAQPRLTLLSASPDPLPAGETRLALGLDWASDFALKGAEPNLTHFVDGEHRTLAVDLRRGITPRVTLGLRVPVRWRGAGVLDGLIDGWHRITGLPDNDRGLYPRNQFVIEGRDALGGGELEIGDETGTGLGNVELSGLWALRRGPQGLAVSLIARAELPTGTGPFEGTGAHAGAQAVAAHPLGRSVDVYFGAGATFFAREDRDDLDYARWRAHGFVTLEWRAARTLSLLIETGAASRLIENIADYPGLQMYFRMGAKLDLGQHWRLEGGFLEGVASIQATSDFGLQAGVGRRF